MEKQQILHGLCSRQLVDFVVNLFKQNKNILDYIIEQNKKDSSE